MLQCHLFKMLRSMLPGPIEPPWQTALRKQSAVTTAASEKAMHDSITSGETFVGINPISLYAHPVWGDKFGQKSGSGGIESGDGWPTVLPQSVDEQRASFKWWSNGNDADSGGSVVSREGPGARCTVFCTFYKVNFRLRQHKVGV